MAEGQATYRVFLKFFPEEAQMWGYAVSNDRFVQGNTQVEFREKPDQKIEFWLHGELKIDSILSGGKKIEYESEKVLYWENYNLVGRKTSIDNSVLADQNSLEIHYSGFFNPSKSRSLSDYMMVDKKEGIFLRSAGYSLWCPVFSIPEITKVDFEQISVDVPAELEVVVGGKPIMEKIDGERKISAWKIPEIGISDVQITGRPFRKRSGQNVWVYYLEDDQKAREITDFAQNLKKIYFKSFRPVQETDPLYIVQMPEYGNISSNNVIGISGDVFEQFETELYSKSTIAHELVHPYVHIPIDRKDPMAALIIEGFPGFFHFYGLNQTESKEEFDLKKIILKRQSSYLKKKESGKDWRGNDLPPEKPILEISFEEIGLYKDYFILSDRVGLFLYHLWTKMGDEKFSEFLKELFALSSIDYGTLENLTEKYLPGYSATLNIWLKTNDFPESLRIIE